MARIVPGFVIALGTILFLTDNGIGQERAPIGRLDPSGAFFSAPFTEKPAGVIIKSTAGSIDSSTYLRYLAARLGTRYLDDLAYDFLLGHECRTRGLARGASRLARGLAAQRFMGSGRKADADRTAEMRRKFAIESLRKMRIDALVRADRKVTDGELRELFHRRYGVNGERVSMRHVLVSFAATRRRLEAAGAGAGDQAVEAAAMKRAEQLLARLKTGTRFEGLLPGSDDRTTRSQLADPSQAAEAGLLTGYVHPRYGKGIGDAARDLDVGQVSPLVRGRLGVHLVRLQSRKMTKLKAVAEALRRELRAERVSTSEALTLKRKLFEKYEYQSRK